ncbi:diacylglycerol kinase, partial [Streptomyces sp. ID05-04B]|nr:diacylglycerol kinase [Streptomyces sp. ID05-04B]
STGWSRSTRVVPVEVDGTTLVDLDQPVEAVSVTPGASGSAEVVVRPSSVGAEAAPLRAYGRTVTVSGADFRYRTDAAVAGPVRRRTWTVREGALALMLPVR